MTDLARTGFTVSMRVSTRQQEERYGLAWQREHLPAYGEQYLGACLGVYDEGAISTSVPFERRDVLQDMLTDLETLRPGYHLVADQDRLARGDDFALIKRELRRLGVRLAFYREGAPPEILDLDDEYGDFSSDIFAAVAKLEKRRIAKRMRRGKQQAAREGKAVQPVPYGYCKPTEGTVAVDPERAAVVILIFERLAGGGWSLRRLVRWLNAEKIPSPRGKVGGWNISYMGKLVRNTAYIGVGRMLGEEVPFPALIDEQTFYRAHAAIEQNKRLSRRNNHRFDYLIRGLAVCGRCGRAITGHPKHNKPYYRCNGRLHDKSKGAACCCDQPEVQAGPIDDAVWTEVSKLVLNPEIISRYAASVPAVVGAEAVFLKRRLARYGERRERLSRQHELGVIDDAQLSRRLVEIAEGQTVDEQKLAALEAAESHQDVDLQELAEAEKLCRGLAPRLATLSFDDRRHLVEKLVRRIVLDGTTVSVEVIVPLVEGCADSAAAVA